MFSLFKYKTPILLGAIVISKTWHRSNPFDVKLESDSHDNSVTASLKLAYQDTDADDIHVKDTWITGQKCMLKKGYKVYEHLRNVPCEGDGLSVAVFEHTASISATSVQDDCSECDVTVHYKYSRNYRKWETASVRI